MSIHPAAVVDSRAILGDGVVVGPGAVIGPDTRIGARTVIGPNAVIQPYTELGEDCRVHACAIIGDIPQDLAFKDTPSRTVVGDRVTFREGVTVHRGTKEGTETRVGNGCYLMANSHLAHNVTLGEGVILANNALVAGYVTIGDRAFISGNCAIHQFCKIGRLVMMGGGCGISKDVLPFCMVTPVSLNRLGGLNVVGMRRAGLTPADRQVIKEAFDLLFRSGMNISQSLDALRQMEPHPLREEYIAFIEKSERGICAL